MSAMLSWDVIESIGFKPKFGHNEELNVKISESQSWISNDDTVCHIKELWCFNKNVRRLWGIKKY